MQDENWQQTSEKIAVMLCPLVQNSNRIKNISLGDYMNEERPLTFWKQGWFIK